MERLQKSRMAQRGWVTRSSSALAGLLADENTSEADLLIELEHFKIRLAKLDEVQSNLELELDVSELEEDILEADTFRRQALKVRVEVEARLQELRQAKETEAIKNTTVQAADDVMSISSTSVRNPSLPKIQIPKFSGDVLDWQSFWDSFSALIHENDTIPVISKFIYLKANLEDKALKVIKGLKTTNDNYSVALELLEDRFGKPKRIIHSHVQALMNIRCPTNTKDSTYVTKLWEFRDEILTHTRGLESLEISGEQCEVFLVPIILSRLPEDIRLEWTRHEDQEGDLEFLLSFLQKEIERLARADTYKEVSTKNKQEEKTDRPKPPKPATASALHTLDRSAEYSTCIFCGKRHKSENCFKMLKLTGQQRADEIRNLDLCYRCLLSGHYSQTCKARCSKCKKPHNALLCGVRLEFSPTDLGSPASHQKKKEPEPKLKPDDATKEVTERSDAGMHTSSAVERGNCTILQTAKVNVVGLEGETYNGKMMFDSGADRVYVSSKFIKRCKPKWVGSTYIPYSSFGGHKSSHRKPSNVYELNILDLENKVHTILAAEIPVICQPLIRPSVSPDALQPFQHVRLADEYDRGTEPLEIDILIGLEKYWDFITPKDAVVAGGLVALKSPFGYVLSGKWNNPNHSVSCSCMTMQFLCISKFTDDELSNFWSLESIGINIKDTEASQNSYILEKFNEEISFSNGRYEVALPWKIDSGKNSLLNNEGIAKKLLHKLHNKLDSNPEMLKAYLDVFRNYEELGIIEEVTDSEIVNHTYYMPHRGVIKESSVSTPIRPVFNASSPGYNGLSLNDCLLTGPSLNPDLVENLIRFRRWPVAVTG